MENKTLIFGGDLHVGDKEYGFTQEVLKLFNDAVYKVFNLESPIIHDNLAIKPYAKAGSNLRQSINNVVKVIKNCDINVLGLANNHMADYGLKGYLETKKVLVKNKTLHSGFGKDLDESSKPIFLMGQKIVIIIAAEEEFGVSNDNRFGIFSLYDSKIIDLIKKYRKAKCCVIVYAHGGGEEIPLPSKYISIRYREFIDNGASLVIGHHPHVVQGKEKYKGKLIYYSLGNFIHASFKKYWGLLLKIQISKNNKFKITEIPIRVNNQVVRLDGHSKWKNLNFFLKNTKNMKGLYDAQCLYMYKFYYESYFKRVGDEQRLLMHLIRNNSHRDFIDNALKILTGEIKSKSDLKSKVLLKKLLNLINE